jgi:hypothetical protein
MPKSEKPLPQHYSLLSDESEERYVRRVVGVLGETKVVLGKFLKNRIESESRNGEDHGVVLRVKTSTSPFPVRTLVIATSTTALHGWSWKKAGSTDSIDFLFVWTAKGWEHLSPGSDALKRAVAVDSLFYYRTVGDMPFMLSGQGPIAAASSPFDLRFYTSGLLPRITAAASAIKRKK